MWRLGKTLSGTGTRRVRRANTVPAALISALALALTLAASPAPSSAAGAGPPSVNQAADCTPTSGTLKGVDVSQFNVNPNFSMVASSGIKFVYARGTDGVTYTDPTYSSYDTNAKAAGLRFGAYAVFEPGQDPTDQANKFIAAAGVSGGDLLPTLDFEKTNGQSPATIQAGITTWLQVVENATGVKPLIYTSKGLWDIQFPSGTGLAAQGYPLWVAQYTANPSPALPSEWTDWTFWQWSDTGSVPGISEQADLDRFNGGDLCVASVPAAPPSNAFSFGKAKLNKRKGTARLPVKVPGPGTLKLRGKGLVPQRSSAAVGAGTVKLTIKPKGKTKRKLKKKGRAKVTAKVTYTPTGGDHRTKSKKLTLKRKRR